MRKMIYCECVRNLKRAYDKRNSAESVCVLQYTHTAGAIFGRKTVRKWEYTMCVCVYAYLGIRPTVCVKLSFNAYGVCFLQY